MEYFKLCAENIEPTRGIFVLDYMDGWASWQPFKHARKVENFRVCLVVLVCTLSKKKIFFFFTCWQCTFEQASYNPVTSKALCHLHFKFRDGSVFKKAFTYDWRRWHLPEIIDVMQVVNLFWTLVFFLLFFLAIIRKQGLPSHTCTLPSVTTTAAPSNGNTSASSSVHLQTRRTGRRT